MSEPMNRKAQSVSQVPNSETKSCNTCKHWDKDAPLSMTCCRLGANYVADLRNGTRLECCAYEPITPDTGKGEGYDYDTI